MNETVKPEFEFIDGPSECGEQFAREIGLIPKINVRKNIVCAPNGDGWLFTIMVGGKSAAYHAVGKTKRKGREDAIKSLRHFLKGEGIECE